MCANNCSDAPTHSACAPAPIVPLRPNLPEQDDMLFGHLIADAKKVPNTPLPSASVQRSHDSSQTLGTVPKDTGPEGPGTGGGGPKSKGAYTPPSRPRASVTKPPSPRASLRSAGASSSARVAALEERLKEERRKERRLIWRVYSG